jgi:hypothetical protein
MKYILLILVFALASCQDTNSNSSDELAFGQPEFDINGGGDTGGSTGDGGASFRFQRAMSVVNQKCISCHSEWPGGGTEAQWVAALDNASADLVDAGNINNSSIFTRLTGCGGSGTGMPPAGPLPSDECDYIQEWIEGIQ